MRQNTAAASTTSGTTLAQSEELKAKLAQKIAIKAKLAHAIMPKKRPKHAIPTRLEVVMNDPLEASQRSLTESSLDQARFAEALILNFQKFMEDSSVESSRAETAVMYSTIQLKTELQLNSPKNNEILFKLLLKYCQDRRIYLPCISKKIRWC